MGGVRRPVKTIPLCELSTIQSLRTVELGWSPSRDERTRSTSRTHNVAELFHLNSNLSARTRRLVAPEDEVSATGRWFHETTYGVDPDGHGLITTDSLPDGLRSLLQPFSEPGPSAALLFGIDLLVENRGSVYRQLPGRAALWHEVDVGSDERRAVCAAFTTGADVRVASHAFLVASPWRLMGLLGPRGYRRALLDAGRVAQSLVSAATSTGVAAHVVSEFEDDILNQALLLDGLDRYVVAVVVWDVNAGAKGE
jgi:nitroreductase family protein